MNEFRQDPVSGQWVIISGDRDGRPNQYRKPANSLQPTSDGEASRNCPFCAQQMKTPPIICRYGQNEDVPWQVCVVPNLYPVMNQEQGSLALPGGSGLLSGTPAIGCHEVVIESPTHQESTSQLTADQVYCMLQAYRDRMLAMRERSGIQFALAMKNSGQDAGASLRHSHSQLFGLPLVPEQVRRELDGALKYFQQRKRCVFCGLIQAELEAGVRIVEESDDFVAWCPNASRFSYEVWLAPRSHHSRFDASDDGQLRSLGKILRSVIGRVDQHPRIDAFNYLVHTQPFETNCDNHYHWHIEILPRTAKQAGFEWGTGIHINTVPPRQAADELRHSVS